MKFKLYKLQYFCINMIQVVDGNGITWHLRDKDGLRVHVEDQTFDHPKEYWNRLVRTKTPLFFAEMHTHATPVDETLHIIQYTTESGEHRTAEGIRGDVWQLLGDTPTMGFRCPSHVSTRATSSNAAWVPLQLWEHTASLPLGWTEPTPLRNQNPPASSIPVIEPPAAAPEAPVAAKIHVCDKKRTPSPPPNETPVVEPVAETPVCDKKRTPSPPPNETPVTTMNYNIMSLSKEEQAQLDSILAEREKFVIQPAKKALPGKKWTRISRVVPAAPKKPRVEWQRPGMEECAKCDKKKKVIAKRHLDFRF
jgi:hypothetical protein